MGKINIYDFMYSDSRIFNWNSVVTGKNNFNVNIHALIIESAEVDIEVPCR